MDSSQKEYKVLYFFFRETDKTKSRLCQMGISLTDQLPLSVEDKKEGSNLLKIFKCFRENNLSARCEEFYDLWNTFLEMVAACDREVLVVDALDE